MEPQRSQQYQQHLWSGDHKRFECEHSKYGLLRLQSFDNQWSPVVGSELIRWVDERGVYWRILMEFERWCQ